MRGEEGRGSGGGAGGWGGRIVADLEAGGLGTGISEEWMEK